jgi:hypothetical protein
VCDAGRKHLPIRRLLLGRKYEFASHTAGKTPNHALHATARLALVCYSWLPLSPCVSFRNHVSPPVAAWLSTV